MMLKELSHPLSNLFLNTAKEFLSRQNGCREAPRKARELRGHSWMEDSPNTLESLGGLTLQGHLPVSTSEEGSEIWSDSVVT